eukprot:CAMPEP_0204582900 /NCGR_PEP_ID=MMETSP0661-20131031/45479_1 /ASSEMBLY_ACC=CAM_ASM_000606 /TAXON_ID=109239 /ORGANISM="Alexandrium margalefi, Strain AMGDE01CS-322" /LENGTH=63 /DNA_ID=CAMNT_0051592217 /DNA_START=18 /DNA_END=206 /DNA_ORIENTATION=-
MTAPGWKGARPWSWDCSASASSCGSAYRSQRELSACLCRGWDAKSAGQLEARAAPFAAPFAAP